MQQRVLGDLAAIRWRRRSQQPAKTIQIRCRVRRANGNASGRAPRPSWRWIVALTGLMFTVPMPVALADTAETMHVPFPAWIDPLLILWFTLTGLTVFYLAWDLFTRTPAMKVMKWGWLLVALYTGPVAFIVYWLSCREPVSGTHEKFVAPQWKQTVGSTIHCMAGDATGVIVAAAVTSLLHTPMWLDSIVEYIAGFVFGLFIFQALFMKDMLGGSYIGAVRATVLPEWLSMNGVMAGMIPTMVILMSHDMDAMDPGSMRFWGIMSLATLVGAIPSYPINWWLVKKGLKHGMGTERALGRGGSPMPEMSAGAQEMEHAGPSPGMNAMDHRRMAHRMGEGNAGSSTPPFNGAGHGESGHGGSGQHNRHVPASSKVIVSILSLLVLAIGIVAAGVYGDFSMSAGRMAGQASGQHGRAGMGAHMSPDAAINSSHR